MTQDTGQRWADAHCTALKAFTEGWEVPGPHSWDRLLAPNVELVQPMLQDGRGREHWWGEAARLIRLVPDVRGEVLSWSASGDAMFIEVRFSGTLGGKPLSWRAVDRLTLTDSGILLRRESHFDSMPLVLTVLRRPRAWVAWWRSGIAPFAVRRRLQRDPTPPSRKGSS